jgi:hypothetical protein
VAFRKLAAFYFFVVLPDGKTNPNWAVIGYIVIDNSLQAKHPAASCFKTSFPTFISIRFCFRPWRMADTPALQPCLAWWTTPHRRAPLAHLPLGLLGSSRRRSNSQPHFGAMPLLSVLALVVALLPVRNDTIRYESRERERETAHVSIFTVFA